jgi:hypothetical protein
LPLGLEVLFGVFRIHSVHPNGVLNFTNPGCGKPSAGSPFPGKGNTGLTIFIPHAIKFANYIFNENFLSTGLSGSELNQLKNQPFKVTIENR